MARTANQLDLARAAGVSVSTVSRALSNSPGISDDLRNRINKLAQELGYTRRGDSGPAARLIRAYVTDSAMAGGLVSFYSAIVESLTKAATPAGLNLEIRLVQDMSLDTDRIDHDSEMSAPDGMMLVGLDPTPEVAARLLDVNSVVLVNAFDPEMRFDCVAPNNFFGSSAATRLLLDAGHRSLLHVRDLVRPTALQRYLGFQETVAATPGARGAVLEARDADEGKLHRAAMERRAGVTDWTGVYCAHDLAAIRMVRALETAGLKVPQDVSVVGFDDLPAASMMSPRLSTVRVDCQAIGDVAITLLLRRIAEPDACPLQTECGIKVVPGGTVAQVASD